MLTNTKGIWGLAFAAPFPASNARPEQLNRGNMKISTCKVGLSALAPIVASFVVSSLAGVGTASAQAVQSHRLKVLQVGTYRGSQGPYATVQSAVDAASPGDWILIAPGAYHEMGGPNDGVLIRTAGIHLRGLDRNGVVVDGTMPSAETCSAAPAAQMVGPHSAGRNGIQVLKVDGVTIENLTVCNFLDGAGGGGYQIWWNGGDGSGHIGMGSYHGAWLTASTTYSSADHAAAYGIFVSNARGPGVIERSYASNMSDSSFYVGACPDCNAVLRHVHAQNSSQGFSGTNAGGHLVLERSEWDHNRVGIASTTLSLDDLPSPQDGACPRNPTRSCTLIRNNYVHDNNNPNTPGKGIAAAVPVGTGILISGGRNDTVRGNRIIGNGAWGVVLNDYPDYSLRGDGSLPSCLGGDLLYDVPGNYQAILPSPVPCYFHSFGNRVLNNRFAGNGSFGNLTNGDLVNAVLDYPRRNCFYGNTDVGTGVVTSAPSKLQDPSVTETCSGPWVTDPNQEQAIFLELLCDSYGPASGTCGLSVYPTNTRTWLLPIPKEPGMEDPCDGVPSNSWCSEEN